MIRDNFLEMNCRTCPVCGREYWAGLDWVYKRGYEKSMKYFCSWTCLRKYDQAKESDKKRIGREIVKAIEEGLSNEEIRDRFGVTQGQIDYRRERAEYDRKTRKRSERVKG